HAARRQPRAGDREERGLRAGREARRARWKRAARVDAPRSARRAAEEHPAWRAHEPQRSAPELERRRAPGAERRPGALARVADATGERELSPGARRRARREVALAALRLEHRAARREAIRVLLAARDDEALAAGIERQRLDAAREVES